MPSSENAVAQLEKYCIPSDKSYRDDNIKLQINEQECLKDILKLQSIESTFGYMLASDCNYSRATFELCVIQLSHTG